MIPFTDFQILPFNKKCDFITVFADYIFLRKAESRKYYLYYMKNYFVEVCYSPEESKVIGIQAFQDIDLIEPYLESVSIDDLYSKLDR